MKQRSNAEEKPFPPGYRLIRTTAEIGDLKKFDPDKMINNEIRNGENGILAKIPKNPSRIVRKEAEDGIWIQFIHDRVYDPEKNQNRIKKTTIGQSVESMLRGMMLVTHRYSQFFDHDGCLIYRGEIPGATTVEAEDLEEIEYEPCPPIPAEAGEQQGQSMEVQQRYSAQKNDEMAIDSTQMRGPGQQKHPGKEKNQTIPEQQEKPTTNEPREKPEAADMPKNQADPIWYFDAKKLRTNEIPFGGDQVLAKIPEIPGWISRRNNPENNTTFIVLILEKHYNPETRQTSKKRTIIGTDAAPAFPGMMIPNESYYKFFDHLGNWIAPEIETDPELIKALKEWTTAREKQRKTVEAAERSKAQKMTESEQENRNTPEEPAQDMRSIVSQHIKSPQHFDYLRMIFLDYNAAVSQQVKKKPHVPMTLYQVLRINEILSELQTIFAGTSVSPYLKLAEVPEDADDESNQLTYGDMDMILKPYYRAINAFLYRGA